MEGTLGGDEPFHQPFKGHITWHFPGRDHKMLLEVSFQHRNVFHSPILQDKPSFLFRSEGGISPLPPVGRCHPVNLKTDLVEVEDKFVAISYPKTPQRIHFLWKFMPVQTNLLLTLFLDDPVQWYSFLLLHLYTIFTPHPLVQSAFMFRLSETWLWLHHCWIEFQFGQKREQASLIFCQTWIGNRIELLGYLQKFA